ncbi:MAG: anthranilate phosphoribosyltransferase [Methanobrevibacter sp.]|jgi:anthranilate phosphoribosyltransferase|nr:anthranilate phosphoribosyltransferase [Methanobrevibacter sp.]
MIKEAILKLAKGEDISYKIACSSMDEIMNGEATDVQMSAYLTALSLKGETISEITASAESMRNHCVKLLHDMDVLEIVGTGGDGSNSFNISTISSIVISAGGVPVAKHGNRAASSACGAADVLESLGVNIEISPEESTSLLEEIGICFLFAQNYHISMKYVAPIRRELGIRTIFNILGPLSNPAGANREVMGVYDESLVLPLAQVLCNLGLKNAMVVYGQDGLDEISISAPTTICEIKDGEFTNYELKPEDFGLERSDKNEIVGGSPEVNAKIALDILNGEKSAKRDAILLNSGAGLYIGGKVNSIEKGIDIAAKVLDNGKAKNQLDRFISLSNQFQ